MNQLYRCLGLAVVVFAGLAVGQVSRAAPLELKRGDHICYLGNTLAERMQHFGWLETRIHARFPKRELVVRNLGFSGDELTHRIRSHDFGSPDKWLTFNKADVIFAFFGYNESYGGQAGLEKFKKDLADFIKNTRNQKYNGKTAPKLVLFSPIAHENLKDRNLPDGKANNKNLALYTKAMAEVAKANQVTFVDLFHPTLELYPKSIRPWTINGVHLNEHGDRQLAGVIAKTLFPGRPESMIARKNQAILRQAVLDKNDIWFHRYRTVDGYSIFGGRADLSFTDGQTNRVVAQREMQILDVMTANRDKKIWAAAQGKRYRVDDANTPPFIPVKTNMLGKGPNGQHIFLGGEEAIGKMRVHKDMKINLFASEEMFPQLAKPVQMSFDTKGRLWVAVWPTYPHWKPKEKRNDKILILEDTKGTGKADKCTVFADNLHCPTGFEFYNGGILVAQAPDLVFLKDTKGTGKADLRVRVLGGLDSADTHHTSNSFVLDPGGAIYFQEGTFHHTQVETPYGPSERCANAGVFRYEPRTQKFEVYVSYSFANPHGHVFDRWGQNFLTDGTGNVNYYGNAFSGRVEYPRKHPGMQPIFNQRTRPCPGTEFLSSKHFPNDMQGNYLVANVIAFHGILMYKIKEKDSGFVGEEVEPIVQSSDLSFRPSALQVGPDGAIYFLDWQNPIIGHMQHNLRDPSRDRVHGRIYRVTYKGRPLSKPVKIAGQPIVKLLDLLKSSEDRVRVRTKVELGGRKSADVIAAVGKWINTLDKNDKDYEHHMMEALWVHQYHNVVDMVLLKRMLKSPDHRARAAATRVLRYLRDQVTTPLDLLEEQAIDKHPRVRLETVVALSHFKTARAAEIALLVLKQPMDYYLNYALKETMITLEPYWKTAVATGKPFATNNPAGSNYILNSVSTPDLVKMTRSAPVYHALLSREGVLHDYRHEAVKALAKLNKTNHMTELLMAIERNDQSASPQALSVLHDLAHILFHHESCELENLRPRLVRLATKGRQPFSRQIAYAALIAADNNITKTWNAASTSIGTLTDLVEAIPVISDAKLRATMYQKIKPLLHGLPKELADKIKGKKGVRGRYVRIDLPGRQRTLTLAEVQVFSGGINVALRGKAKQSSTAHGGDASKGIDGNTNGSYGAGGQTHTREGQRNPWWEVDLGSEVDIETIVVWNRTDGNLGSRLQGFKLSVLDDSRRAVFVKENNPAPAVNVRFEIGGGDPAGRVRRAAINAVTFIEGHEVDTFTTLAKFIKDGQEREACVRAIRRLPKNQWPVAGIRPLLAVVVAHVSKLPTDKRTEPAVLEELQLGNELAALLPAKEAQEMRTKLGELGVAIVSIRTVPHKMVYDRAKFYVVAGKPVVIVLENADIMPHNLLICTPGSLTEIGMAAERMAAEPDGFAKHFIPNSPKVLHSVRMLQPREVARLQFNAPTKPGEYPYVCTFPGHWRLMYGTMHVVKTAAEIPPDELQPDAEVKARPFVRNWTVDELVPLLNQLDRGRSFENGKKMFTAASCVQCHTIGKDGGLVGPNLNELPKKLADKKFSRKDILREIIHPSAVINVDFKTYQIETNKGELLTGVIIFQDKKIIRIQTNPLLKPRDIPIKQIAEKRETKISMMPEGLLTTLNKEEVLDLLAYIMSGANSENGSFK